MRGGPFYLADVRLLVARVCAQGLSPFPMSDNPSAPTRILAARHLRARAARADRPPSTSPTSASRTWRSPRSIRRAIAERGYTHPTPVQAKAFGPVMEGKDLIVRSKTGTGKTAAFGLPLLEKIPAGRARRCARWSSAPPASWRSRWPQELARPGQAQGRQGRGHLRRRLDEARRRTRCEEGRRSSSARPAASTTTSAARTSSSRAARTSVLDEADEMLNQGFYEEVTRILDQPPEGPAGAALLAPRCRRTSRT